MKLESKWSHLVMKFDLKRASEITLGTSQSLCTKLTNSKTVISTTCKGISDNHCRLHPQLARTGAVLSYHPFGRNQKWNQENGTSYCCFYKGILPVRVGADIFRPVSESVPKFAESGALQLIHRFLIYISYCAFANFDLSPF